MRFRLSYLLLPRRTHSSIQPWNAYPPVAGTLADGELYPRILVTLINVFVGIIIIVCIRETCYKRALPHVECSRRNLLLLVDSQITMLVNPFAIHCSLHHVLMLIISTFVHSDCTCQIDADGSSPQQCPPIL